MVELIREKYLSKILPFAHDSGMVKVITGTRGCGKTVLLSQIRDGLIRTGTDADRIFLLDLEKPRYRKVRTADDLEAAIDELIGDVEDGKHLFIEGIRNVEDFEPLINAYRNDGVSIFLTANDSDPVNGMYATKLTGRYITFNIGTFSFDEVRAYFEVNKIPFDAYSEFRKYLEYGGYPGRFAFPDTASQEEYIRNLVVETIRKDMFGLRKVRDRELLKRVLDYVISASGTEISTTSIAEYFRNEGINTLPSTVGRDLDIIFSSMIASKCRRYDLVTDRELKTRYVPYAADPSLYALFPERRAEPDMETALKIIVYNELVSRGYDVFTGKHRYRNIDFVVTRPLKTAYIQVANNIGTHEAMERETVPLLSIRDGYPKYVLSMDPIRFDQNGIHILHLVDDFLLGDRFVL